MSSGKVETLDRQHLRLQRTLDLLLTACIRSSMNTYSPGCIFPIRYKTNFEHSHFSCYFVRPSMCYLPSIDLLEALYNSGGFVTPVHRPRRERWLRVPTSGQAHQIFRIHIISFFTFSTHLIVKLTLRNRCHPPTPSRLVPPPFPSPPRLISIPWLIQNRPSSLNESQFPTSLNSFQLSNSRGRMPCR